MTVGECPQVTARQVDGMPPVLHYPLPKPRNARDGPSKQPSCRTSWGQRAFEHTTAHPRHYRHGRNNTPTQHTKPRDEILSAHAPHTARRNETFTAPARHKQPKFAHFHHAGANFLSQHTPHTPTGATFLSTNRPTSSPNTTPQQQARNIANQQEPTEHQKRTACDITTTVGQTPQKSRT